MTIILEHNTVKLKQKAWHGDCPLMLSFPAAWQVELIGDQALPALTAADLQAAIKRPIESPSLGSLVQGKSNAIILIDDLSRPTPAADLLPPVIDELLSAGLRAEQISILSAGGTHPPDEQEALVKKTGILPDGIQVYTHNSHNDLAALGITKQGTPIHINQKVANSDLKIGIGCIYPHPAAGFSGGAKIIAPGAAGSDTIRIMHDKCRGAQHRAGSIETEFRQEISGIAERVGLNFIVNVTLNQQRSISGIFAGHPQHAFEQGVAFARQQYSVPPPPHADIIIADMYPFDIDFQVAFDRGLWPIEMAGRSTTKVLLASCPQGMGEHELFPVSDPFFPRLKRRLQSLSPADLFRLGIRLRAIKKIIRRKQMQVFILSQSLQEGDLKKSLPQSQILPDWESLLQVLLQKHDENCPVQVVIYRCAPLMLPTSKGEK